MHYHAHIYWCTPEQKITALNLRSQLSDLDCNLGRVWDQAIGPHPLPMYQINYNTGIQDAVEKLLEQSGLTVLLHEDTGDDMRDHTQGARWLNRELKLDFEWLEEHTRKKHDSMGRST